jgi:hypothetical protein
VRVADEGNAQEERFAGFGVGGTVVNVAEAVFALVCEYNDRERGWTYHFVEPFFQAFVPSHDRVIFN